MGKNVLYRNIDRLHQNKIRRNRLQPMMRFFESTWGYNNIKFQKSHLLDNTIVYKYTYGSAKYEYFYSNRRVIDCLLYTQGYRRGHIKKDVYDKLLGGSSFEVPNTNFSIENVLEFYITYMSDDQLSDIINYYSIFDVLGHIRYNTDNNVYPRPGYVEYISTLNRIMSECNPKLTNDNKLEIIKDMVIDFNYKLLLPLFNRLIFINKWNRDKVFPKTINSIDYIISKLPDYIKVNII